MNKAAFHKIGPYCGPIIDFHTHLTLHWQALPGKPHQRDPYNKDPWTPVLRWFVWNNYELLRYHNFIRRKSLFEAPMERILSRIIRSFTREEREDLLLRMDRTGITQSVVLAVPPVVTNEAVLAECAKTERLVPFISPCPDSPPEPQLERLLASGGRGIKVHPLLQQLKVDGDFVTRVARIAAARNVPLVLHSGGSVRLFGLSSGHRTEPVEFARLAKRVPAANIVVAHAGLWECPEILREVAPFQNLFLDVSFQSPGVLKQIKQTIPLNRLLLGSDSPMGNVSIVMENCVLAGFSEHELRALFWKNPRRLLGDSEPGE
ncbi:MAG: amidohydrolase family protein [Candidatus Ozemobacteraceae bacterium]